MAGVGPSPRTGQPRRTPSSGKRPSSYGPSSGKRPSSERHSFGRTERFNPRPGGWTRSLQRDRQALDSVLVDKATLRQLELELGETGLAIAEPERQEVPSTPRSLSPPPRGHPKLRFAAEMMSSRSVASPLSTTSSALTPIGAVIEAPRGWGSTPRSRAATPPRADTAESGSEAGSLGRSLGSPRSVGTPELPQGVGRPQSGQQSRPGSPLSKSGSAAAGAPLPLGTGVVHPGSSTATGTGLSTVALRVPALFVVQPRDSSGSPCRLGAGESIQESLGPDSTAPDSTASARARSAPATQRRHSHAPWPPRARYARVLRAGPTGPPVSRHGSPVRGRHRGVAESSPPIPQVSIRGFDKPMVGTAQLADGRVVVKWQPSVSGEVTLGVTINGSHIRGSPFRAAARMGK